MFGSHNAYGGYGNNYGNAPYYSTPASNDSFLGNNVNRQAQNHVNYRNPTDASIASDSLYGLDSSMKQIETGVAGINLNKSKGSEDYGSLKSMGTAKKTTTWASIASQPAKSQPKLLKSKMAASGLTGSTSKHLPPTVTMDAISWESKNGALGNGPLGSKTLPPPTVISAPTIAPAVPFVPPARSVSPVMMEPPHLPMGGMSAAPAPPPPSQVMPRSENPWHTNGNSSPVGSLHNSDSSPRSSRTPTLPRASQVNSEHNGNYNQNKYSNQRGYPKQPTDNQSSSTRSQTHSVNSAPPSNSSDDMSSKENVLEKLIVQNNYNPREFNLDPSNARFFIIKSYSEDDIHRSIKYSIWCSTEHGNRRLDTAFREQENKGPIYLFFSVNRSGHFCGIAQMMSPVDYNASSGVWCQDKWKGQFKVKWIYIKDVPNDQLRHITLENNENKPVTNSRDTQEVPYEKGKKVLAIIHLFNHQTSIFDDFLHYEKKQEEELLRKPDSSSPPPPPNHYQKMPLSSSQYNSRDNQMSFRGGPPPSNNYNNQPRERGYPDREPYRVDGYRNDHRTDYRNDYGRGYGRDDRERSREHRDHRPDYRDGPSARDYGHRVGGEQYHLRDSYRERDYHALPPHQRDFPRDRGDYREHRSERNHHNDRQQSWRN